jgi:hypothetical protein
MEVIDRQPLAEEQPEQKLYLKVHLLVQALCCLQMDSVNCWNSFCLLTSCPSWCTDSVSILTINRKDALGTSINDADIHHEDPQAPTVHSSTLVFR